MKPKFLKFFPLVKVDVAQRMVYGLVTAEVEDRDGETCHYDSTKTEYQKVVDEMGKASDGQNIMPLREMHQLIAAGAGKAISFDDPKKQIHMGFYVSDNSTWQKVLDKVLLGFSQGGSYVRKWAEAGKQMYTAGVGEVSLVDRPCLAGALIEYVKADGSVEMFKTAGDKLSDADVDRLVKALESRLVKGVKYLVPDGNHLPYTDESGKPNHRLMGAAWAALHGGYRGNKYEGPGKEQAIAHLKEIYHSEGMEPPSEKAAAVVAAIEKAKKELEEFGEYADFDTGLEKNLSDMVSLVAKLAKGVTVDMNPEQIKKCAAALGISEEEFKKQYVEGDALEKGKKGLAALHAHLKKAVAHHSAMHKAHKAMAEDHATMADHLENCMKAHGACMDDAEAEKVLKALGVNPAPAADPKNEPTELEKKLQAQIDELKKALDAKPADDAADRARLIAVQRGKEVEKAAESNKVADALPV